MRAYPLSQYDIRTDASPCLYVSEDEKQLLEKIRPTGVSVGLHPVEIDPDVFEENKRTRPYGMSDLLSLAKLKARQ